MLKKLFLLFFFIFVGFIGYIFYWFKSPNPLNQDSVDYHLQEGSTFMRVAYDLEKLNVLRYPKLFIDYAKIMHLTGNLKIGTYRFHKDISPEEILTKLVKGDIVTIKVTIPEGLNIYQISEKLAQDFPKTTKENWLEIVNSKDLIPFLGLKTNAVNLEGFIFPETYVFDPNLSPKSVIKSILSEFKKNVTPEMFQKAKGLGLSPLEYITLSSIVEKETAVSSERERVAGVYWNRLKIKMRLQADPTVIYGIWNKYKGSITKRDLLTPTPYNTYTNYGLPPGPIASPGIASLKATLNPVSKDLYFVAKGDGTHIFSQNLKDHNIAVRKYVIFLKANRQKE
ncbi:endolytic transglycosylase MltG [Silvanigrella sp.]|jgi:UPF0755 protein|uniref:endolytic transglycosylase MltG n=1 Tax=Silvanigrella sp. TaxID=2024976 RepID=UPI0037CB5350|nr:endolytic transglycosylase MltG [Silvanigrellaceae bacterium]